MGRPLVVRGVFIAVDVLTLSLSLSFFKWRAGGGEGVRVGCAF